MVRRYQEVQGGAGNKEVVLGSNKTGEDEA